MTAQPHHGLGHITSSQDPGWCVYCAEAVPLPPAWDWATARQEVIVRAAQEARWQRKDRLISRRRAELFAAARRADQAMARAARAATYLAIALRSGAA